MQNTVIQFSVQRMVCTGCGVEANASCSCGVAYSPKVVRAAEAIKANPQKSNRAIADDLGVSEGTVRSARNSGAQDYAPEAERTGRDGKSYPVAQKPKQQRGPRFETPSETQHDRDLRALLGIWSATCESARSKFLETVNS